MTRATWLLLFVVLLLAGCTGGSGGSTSGGAAGVPVPNSLGLTRVGIDDSRATRATVGPAGGTLTTVGPDGSRYTLTIPPGVLAADTEIGMYPLTGLAGVGSPPSLVGVHLTPEGLHFDTPATLTIQLRDGLPAQTMQGLAYTGDGEGLHPFPVAAASGTLTFLLSHFSGAGAGQGLPATVFGATSAEDTALGVVATELFDLSLLADPSPEILDTTAEEIAEALDRWFTDSVRPRLVSLPNLVDSLEAHAALNEYSTWRVYASGYALPASIASRVAQLFQARILEAAGLAGQGLRARFDLDNDGAALTDDLSLAVEAMGWYERARSLGHDTQTYRLDLETVLEDLVLEVHFEETDFPADLGAGDSGTLRVKVGYRIGSHPTRFDQPMDVLVEAQNGVVTGPSSGETDLAGVFTTTVQRQSDSPDLIVLVTASFANAALARVSAEASIVRGPPQPAGPLGRWSGTHGGRKIDNGGSGPPGSANVIVYPDLITASFYVGTTRVGIFRSAPVTPSGNVLNTPGTVWFCDNCSGGPGTFTATVSPDGTTMTGTLRRDDTYFDFVCDGREPLPPE